VKEAKVVFHMAVHAVEKVRGISKIYIFYNLSGKFGNLS